MEISDKTMIKLVAGSLTVAITAMLLIRNEKKDNSNYQILSGNGKTYYVDTFQIVNKGVMFDDIYGRKVIVMGNIDIEYKKKDK
jgi:hypothetical protein